MFTDCKILSTASDGSRTTIKQS